MTATNCGTAGSNYLFLREFFTPLLLRLVCPRRRTCSRNTSPVRAKNRLQADDFSDPTSLILDDKTNGCYSSLPRPFPPKAGLLLSPRWRMTTAYGELLMPLAIALLESLAFSAYFFGYDSYFSPSMYRSWVGGVGEYSWETLCADA